MSNLSDDLRQRTRAHSAPRNVMHIIEDVTSRLQSLADKGIDSVVWSHIKQGAWNLTSSQEELVLNYLSCEGIDVTHHVLDRREHNWIELSW